jgi:hypothetical protein
MLDDNIAVGGGEGVDKSGMYISGICSHAWIVRLSTILLLLTGQMP